MTYGLDLILTPYLGAAGIISKLTFYSIAEQKTTSATSNKPIRRVATTYGQKTRVEPVPMNVKSTSLVSSSQSQPFIATVTLTVSLQIESGSSQTLGVTHLIVVLFKYTPMLVPNLPNLHWMPYWPVVPLPVEIAIGDIRIWVNYAQRTLSFRQRTHRPLPSCQPQFHLGLPSQAQVGHKI